MTIGSGHSGAVLDGNAAVNCPTIGEILRLLGAGAPGAILLALGDGPLRTTELTARVPGYAARTIYRHLPKLTELGVVDREGADGATTRVVLALSYGSGTEFHRLIGRFADAFMIDLPGGQIEAPAWGSLGVLADLWEAGVLAELSKAPHSPTELAMVQQGLSYHQVARRTGLFNTAGFLCESEHVRGQRRCHALTDRARRVMGLIADIGRWRQRFSVEDLRAGMSVAEMATVLRASLPLVRLPQYAGHGLEIEITAGWASEAEALWIGVGDEGALECMDRPVGKLTAVARGAVEAWLDVVLEGEPQIAVDGDAELVTACLRGLYDKLWTPSPF